VLALSKADLVPPEAVAAAARAWHERLGVPVIVTSAATGQGIAELAAELVRRVPLEPVAPALPEPEELAEHRVFRPAAERGFTVERTGAHAFRVAGRGIERLLARHDLDNEESLAYVEHRLRRLGVIGALEAEGFAPGDDVEIGGVVFDLDPEATR